jgi:ketosteroid isomerase-like protein
MIAFAALAGCTPAPAPLTDADRAAARGMDSAYAVATSAGNVNGMMAGLAPDAMVLPPNMPMAHGTDQIRQLYSAMPAAKGTLQLTQETADGAGDFMYTTGKYHYQMSGETGASEDGKYLEVFHRGADGKWTLAAESWSSNAAPAAPAPAAKPAAPRRAK